MLRKWLRSAQKETEAPKFSRAIPDEIAPRCNQPSVPTFGRDIEALRSAFEDLSIDGGPRGGLRGYAGHDMERFLRTVELIPESAATALEIGANPYFTSILTRWFKPNIRLSLTNYFGPTDAVVGSQSASIILDGDEHVFDFQYSVLNVEGNRYPFNDESFDVVLYCEVIEHLLNDPAASLREAWRVLKEGGMLILTTPNASRIENATRLLAGLNVYDQYSGHGPYGRHNREYTVSEIAALIKHCGFDLDQLYTADVHENHAAIHIENPDWLIPILSSRKALLGQYIFTRSIKGIRRPNLGLPSWLYRSIPDHLLSDDHPIIEPAGSRW